MEERENEKDDWRKKVEIGRGEKRDARKGNRKREAEYEKKRKNEFNYIL